MTVTHTLTFLPGLPAQAEVEEQGGGKGAGGLTHAGKRCALTSLHGTLVALREGVVEPRLDALRPCGHVARAGPKKLLS